MIHLVLLFIYAGLVLFITPKISSSEGFFLGKSEEGKPASLFYLTSSIFISWIMAKSITNAANLGYEYGIVGGFSYALYWLCIPIAGFIIYRLRTKFGAISIVDFINEHYGRTATFVFTGAIFIRLFNEVWSNTSVVGGYFGPSGSGSFVMAAIIFTIVTLLYCLKGGYRSSLFTDAIQTVVFTVFLVLVIFWVMPKTNYQSIRESGHWTWEGGFDLVLVTFIQLFSYPFHDPVLTDMGFITDEKKMLKAFIISGLAGFVAIFAFSIIGIYAKVNGITFDGNVLASITRTANVFYSAVITIIMIAAAGSTLDSTFSSVSKLVAYDLPNTLDKKFKWNPVHVGMFVMIFIAVLGNIPMLFGTSILKATTISGTMVIGFMPIFCLHGWIKSTKLGFYLSFWAGMLIGFMYSFGLLPNIFAIGNGKHAMLLGVNLWGTVICTVLYVLAGLFTSEELVNE